MAKQTASERYEGRIQVLTGQETAAKVSAMAGVGMGTHRGYQMVAHRRAQRGIEQYETKLFAELHPDCRGLASWDRAAVRKAACYLTGIEYGNPNIDAEQKAMPLFDKVSPAYHAARAAGTLRVWLGQQDGKSLAALYLCGLRNDELGKAIQRAALAHKPRRKAKTA